MGLGLERYFGAFVDFGSEKLEEILDENLMGDDELRDDIGWFILLMCLWEPIKSLVNTTPHHISMSSIRFHMDAARHEPW